MHAYRTRLLMIIISLTLSACDRDKPASQAPRDNEGKAASGAMRGIRRESLKLMADNAAEGDSFGAAVAANDDVALIGAPSLGIIGAAFSMAGDRPGSAYVFDITTGEQLLKLTASEAENGDRFGSSVAISGNIAVVGAPRERRAKEAGTAHVFNITTGEHLFELTAPDDADGRGFGTSVAIDGDVAVVGALWCRHNGRFSTGAAYIFDVTTGEQLFKLTPSDAAETEGFGTSVAIIGNIAIARTGTLPEDEIAFEERVYVFDVTTGAELRKFSTPNEGEKLAGNVAIHGDIAIIGSRPVDDKGNRAGSAHLFDITTGEQLRELTTTSLGNRFSRFLGVGTAIGGDVAIVGGLAPSMAHVYSVTTGKEYLRLRPSLASIPTFSMCELAVTPSGDRAIMGVPEDHEAGEEAGAAYVFDLTKSDDAPWPMWCEGRELFKLTASDDEAREVGHAVAVSGSIAIVGTPLTDTDAGEDAGAAYVFDIKTGEQLFQLTAPDGIRQGGFGASVAIDGDTAIVGAPGGGSAAHGSGAAYLFDVTTGELLAELTSPEPEANSWFGGPVAINGDIAIVGGDDDDATNGVGAAYTFDIKTGEALLKLTASDADEHDYFPSCVAISGGIAIIGSPGDDSVAENAGAAYLFDVATGERLFKLTASDGGSSRLFGASVAIRDNIAIVGSTVSAHSFGNSSAAYVFDITTGEQLVKLTGAIGHGLGASVAISGDIAIVGARDSFCGWACLFDIMTGELLLEMMSPSAQSGDMFGRSVALSGNVAVVAAPGADRVVAPGGGGPVEGRPDMRGALYVFELLIPAAEDPIGTGPGDDAEEEEDLTHAPAPEGRHEVRELNE